MVKPKSSRDRLLALASQNDIKVRKSNSKGQGSKGAGGAEGEIDEEEPPPPFPTWTMVFGSSTNNCLGPVKASSGLKRAIFPNAIPGPPPPTMRQRVMITGGGKGKVITPGSVVPSSNGPHRVFAGHRSTSVVTDQGRIYTWGYRGNNESNLGHTSSGAAYNALIPAVAEPAGSYEVVSHSFPGGTGKNDNANNEETYSVAVTKEGRLYGWGKGGNGKMANVMKGGGRIKFENCAVDASAGAQFTMVVGKEGGLWGCGNNDAGQLGMGDTNMRRALEIVKAVGPTVKFRRVSCGINHTCALAVSGEAYSFGWGGNGRLGLGDTNKRTTPQLVEKLKDELLFAMDVACGGASTSVLSDQGDVWSWGWNCYGQCGVSKVNAGSEESGLMSGFNSTGSGFDSPHFDNYGSAGDCLENGEEVENVLVPAPTLVGKVITSLSLGFAHGACVSAVGELFSWGFNEEGQLGLGHEENVFEPEIVPIALEMGGEALSSEEKGDLKVRVLDVACGHTHTACVVSKLSSVQNDLRRRDADFRRKAATVLLRFGKWCLFNSLRRKKYRKEKKPAVAVQLVVQAVEEEVDVEAERRRREEEEEEERRKREAVLAERRRAEELLEKKRLEDEERKRKALEEEEQLAKERRREETERMLMKREDDAMRRFLNDERLMVLAKEEERERRRMLEIEEQRRFDENELMRLEDERGRLAVAYRRQRWEEMKRAKEGRLKAKEEERLAREAKRLMDVKKAADRLKNARKKAAEKKQGPKVIKRSGSAGGVGLGNGMEERLKMMADEKRKKEELEARNRAAQEKKDQEERAKAELKRARMIEKREKRLAIEREEAEQQRLERLEAEREEREREEEEREREEELLRAEEEERQRRAAKLAKIASRGRRGSREEEERAVELPQFSEKPVFHSAHQWGRKLSKTGGVGGKGGVVRGGKK
ncbi:hypothetical protein TrVE_jg10599 [Triparma verrucosa]|uniref:RCC1-like domain-containing protein n=1 Tax=Triparma verrucosa TaxID=1606542 RepID=A0A9W7F5X9_9STRA|nr:hypothetical protein TrVE_jg10599 [Triparma verrucosa]